jgi:hypothetical protein
MVCNSPFELKLNANSLIQLFSKIKYNTIQYNAMKYFQTTRKKIPKRQQNGVQRMIAVVETAPA